AAPDTMVLAGFEGPREALFAHVAAAAHLLRLLDLHDRGAGVADGEEQFRVLIEASGPVAPIHGGSHLSSHRLTRSAGGRSVTAVGVSLIPRCERFHEHLHRPNLCTPEQGGRSCQVDHNILVCRIGYMITVMCPHFVRNSDAVTARVQQVTGPGA